MNDAGELSLRTSEGPEYQEISREDISFDKDDKGKLVRLGIGGFGVVYKGSYINIGHTKVAIKRIKETASGIDNKVLKELKREAKTMYCARFPDIVTVFGLVADESIEHDQIFALVTEYMERGSLDKLLDKHRIPWNVKMKILEEVTRGLIFLCNEQPGRPYKIIHGDIKTANILIDYNFRAKITDFGTAKLQQITSKSTCKDFKMTVAYAAPEILHVKVDGNPKATEKSDVWSFGICVFEVCAEIKPDPTNTDIMDRLPFQAGFRDVQLNNLINPDMDSLFTSKQEEKVPQDCPPFLCQLYKECCLVEPNHRPTFNELHKCLMDKYDSKQYDKAMLELWRNIQDEGQESRDGKKNQPSYNIDAPVASHAAQSMPEVMRSSGGSLFAERQGEERVYNNNNDRDGKNIQLNLNFDTLDYSQATQNMAENVSSSNRRLAEKPEAKSLFDNINNPYSYPTRAPTNNTTAEIKDLKERSAIKSREIKDLKERNAIKSREMSDIKHGMQGMNLQLANISDQLRLQPKTSDIHQLQNQVGYLATRDDLSMALSHVLPIDQPVYEYKQPILGDNLDYLLDNLDPGEILDYMYQEFLMEEEEIIKIKEKGSCRVQAKLIVEKVDSLGEDAVRKFINILDQAQAFIADYLRQGYRKLKLRQHLQLMQQHLRPENIIVTLFSQEILTLNDKEELGAVVTTSGKVEKLFDILYKSKHFEVMDKLVKALDKDNQKKLADSLRN